MVFSDSETYPSADEVEEGLKALVHRVVVGEHPKKLMESRDYVKFIRTLDLWICQGPVV